MGSFEHLHHIVRMEGHVSSAEGFFERPAVLGEKAGHARSAFSHPRLPLDLPVELVVIAQILPT